MFKLSTTACIMLVFASSAHALETAAPAALSLESVPPSSFTQQTELLESTHRESMAPVLPINENDTPKYRPVIVVRLQPSEPIIDQTVENMLTQQSDADWKSHRQDRLVRFMELADRNVASPKPALPIEPQRVRYESAPNMSVLAGNYGYGLGFGWPLDY